MRIFLAELATSDAVVPIDNLFREARILQGPKGEDARLEVFGRGTNDVVLTVTNSNQVLIDSVYIHAGDLSTVSQIALEFEQMLQFDSFLLLIVYRLLILFVRLVFFLVVSTTEANLGFIFLLSVLIILLSHFAHIGSRIVFIKHMRLMELGLREQSLNDLDALHHGLRQFLINDRDIFGFDVTIVTLHASLSSELLRRLLFL